MAKLLIVNSLLTLAGGCWLVLMELVLRHPGYGTRTAVAACISLICLATLLARGLRVNIRVERWLWAGAFVLLWIGAQAFTENLSAVNFEGFAFVLSIIILLQGALMLVTLGWPYTTASTRHGS